MKGLKITGKVLLYTLVTLVILLALLYIGVTAVYFSFFNETKGEFIIPGLTTPFVPQGFDYVQEQDCYLMSGYMSDKSASRVYVRFGNGDTHDVELLNADGTAYTRHSGGVTHNGEFVYVAGKNGVEVFRLSDFLNGNQAVNIGRIPAEYDIAFCTFYNGYLFAGDFYYPEDYETPENHRITTPAGDANTAVISVYKADESCEFGIDPTPVAAISTRGKVQGICFTSDSEIVLSTSYSVYSSNLYFYDIDTERQGSMTLMDTEVPLYYLDSANLTETVTMPPMSEELVCKDGRIYIMFESACNKYIFGKFIRGYQVYSYPLEG